MSDHYPNTAGGPGFAMTCEIDGEPWPCTAAQDGQSAPADAPVDDQPADDGAAPDVPAEVG